MVFNSGDLELVAQQGSSQVWDRAAPPQGLAKGTKKNPTFVLKYFAWEMTNLILNLQKGKLVKTTTAGTSRDLQYTG